MEYVVPATVEKGNIKLTEHSDADDVYGGKFFLQNTCIGFYLNKEELLDLATVINYYLNADEIADIKISIGGEYVAP